MVSGEKVQTGDYHMSSSISTGCNLLPPDTKCVCVTGSWVATFTLQMSRATASLRHLGWNLTKLGETI